MPRAALILGKKAPCLVHILLREQYSHARAVRLIAEIVAFRIPLPPYYAQEQRTGRRHDRDVRENPASLVTIHRLDDPSEEWMPWHGADGIV